MPKKAKDETLNGGGSPKESAGAAMAKTALRPTLHGAVAIRQYDNWLPIDLDLNELVKALGEQAKAVIDDDLSRAEAMLAVQAHTLDAIFNNLSRRALSAKLLSQFETYLKLGLRAQSQCRSTWEAISAIKHPPVAGYVNQANIAHGHQQVNNVSRAQENKKPPNELLEEAKHGPETWLDCGAPQATGQIDWVLETVDEVDGPEESGGQGQGSKERL